MPAPRFVLDDFWPSDLFLGGIPGAWYDPTDLSTMFQDNTGLTPVTAVEQPVGLIFDKSQGTPAARRNLFTYTEQFDNAYWFKAGGAISSNTTLAPDGTVTADTWTAAAGNSRHEMLSNVGAGPATVANQNYTFSLYVKKGTHNYITLLVTANVTVWYAATFDFSGATPVVSKTGAGTSGTIVSTNVEAASNGFWRISVTGRTTDVVSIGCPVLASSATPAYAGFGEENWNAAGTETAIFWGAQIELGTATTTYQKITTGIGGEWTPGNHASQSTAASRPTYRARYNLLTDSENFGPPWSVDNATVTTDTTIAPDGTLTADTLTPSGSLTAFANRVYRVPANLISGATYVVSVWAKSSIANAKMTLSIFNYGGQVFTLTSSWQRYSVSIVAGGTSPNTNIYAGEVNPTTGAIISTNVIQIWGAQLMTAADAAATGNAYQRIAAATVYDTAPVFRPYLAFDGMDDGLRTSAINFTSTNKLTIFYGVTKNTDTVSVISELSANINSNAGSFICISGTNNVTGFEFTSIGSAIPPTLGQTGRFTVSAPATSTITCIGDIAAPLARIRSNTVNGVDGTGNQGVGNYGNYALFIGARNGGASLRFNGRVYEYIIRGAASSVTEIADTELWVNARTGGY